MKLTAYILTVLALGAYAAPAAIEGVSQLTGRTSRVTTYLLTLVVSCRVGPLLSRPVGQQTPLPLPLRRRRQLIFATRAVVGDYRHGNAGDGAAPRALGPQGRRRVPRD